MPGPPLTSAISVLGSGGIRPANVTSARATSSAPSIALRGAGARPPPSLTSRTPGARTSISAARSPPPQADRKRSVTVARVAGSVSYRVRCASTCSRARRAVCRTDTSLRPTISPISACE